MASSSRRDYEQAPQVDDDDLIDPDDGTRDMIPHRGTGTFRRLASLANPLFAAADLNDFDDPLATQSSSRTPLTGNIGSSSSSSGGGRPLNENYLTSRIPGEDRRAPTNTIDESVWETLRRDLLAVWGKMREVLYPRYLFGGTMFESGDGLRGAYANLRSAGLAGTREELAGLAGRVLDPEALLSGNHMTAGLRDWDLWGPLIFCLLLSLLLSFNARADQKDVVFSGVFAMVWIGEAVVTLQIKLLGGNMYVPRRGPLSHRPAPPLLPYNLLPSARSPANGSCPSQLLCAERVRHWLHPLPARHRGATVRLLAAAGRPHPRLPRPRRLGAGRGHQHPRRQRRCQEPCGHCRLPPLCLLFGARLSLLHQLGSGRPRKEATAPLPMEGCRKGLPERVWHLGYQVGSANYVGRRAV